MKRGLVAYLMLGSLCASLCACETMTSDEFALGVGATAIGLGLAAAASGDYETGSAVMEGATGFIDGYDSGSSYPSTETGSSYVTPSSSGAAAKYPSGRSSCNPPPIPASLSYEDQQNVRELERIACKSRKTAAQFGGSGNRALGSGDSYQAQSHIDYAEAAEAAALAIRARAR